MIPSYLVADDEIVKVHVHTNHPGQAIERALTYGALSRMKIDNMREEHQEKLIKDAEKLAKQQAEEEKKQRAAQRKSDLLPYPSGDGLTDIFKELGVDYLIEGGQTMNPSTEDMLNAIDKVNAKTIYIFPNNKNIILAANQARDLTEDKKIIVIPTKTVPQGITALISFVPEKSLEENTADDGRSDRKSQDRTDHLCGKRYPELRTMRSMRVISWESAIRESLL